MCVGIKRILGCGLLLLISILMMGANAETAPGRLGWAVGVCPNSMRGVAFFAESIIKTALMP
jgi:hypothetical protein